MPDTTVQRTQVTRTREIEEASNLYFIHPISRALVSLFARLGIHPNLVSLLGLALGGAAALAYYQYARWDMALLGFGLMIGWHVMDGADGQLARLTGKTSEIGKVLDGLCDHGTFIMVYLSMTVALVPVVGGWIWALAWAAGLSHIAQSSAYEFQRQSYDYWVHAKATARVVPLDTYRQEVQNKQGLTRLFAQLNVVYLGIQRQFAAIDETLQAQLAATLDEHPGAASDLREAYRSLNRDAVKKWSVLGSNYRTLAIFLAALAGNPILFFLYEFVLLNGALFLLTRLQRRRNRALRAWLAGHAVKAPAAETLVSRPQ